MEGTRYDRALQCASSPVLLMFSLLAGVNVRSSIFGNHRDSTHNPRPHPPDYCQRPSRVLRVVASPWWIVTVDAAFEGAVQGCIRTADNHRRRAPGPPFLL